MRTVDITTARTFLQKIFLDREKMMSKEKLIKLVANNLRQSTRYDVGDTSKDQWFEISDTRVQSVRLQQVLSQEAYLLFYERLE